MSELLHHRFSAELEVRSGGDGRTVMGICCPFDSPTPINEWGMSYTEQFLRGSFEKTIAERQERIKFLAMHDRGAFPLGRAQLLREDALGLYGEFYVSKTERGDEALELIRDGALDGFSVGFAPIRSTPDNPRSGDLVSRLEVRLSEVSAVSFPAYDDARIVGVRAAHEAAEAALERLLTEPTDTLDIARVERLLGLVTLARAGKALSTASMSELQAVLDLVADADRSLDEAQPRLAQLMGVPNPDEPETPDATDEPDEGRSEPIDAGDETMPIDAETRDEPDADEPTGTPYDMALRIARRHRVTV